MSEPLVDFALLELDAPPSSALNRRAMIWLGGMLMLVAVSIVLLALFLRAVEAEEEDRRRTADAQWLDQTLRFHFRRLEGDLAVLALQAQRPDDGEPPALRAGQLWRSPGVIAFHGWLPAGRQGAQASWPPFMQAAARQGDNAQALHTMLATTRGLERAAYAGPLRQADGRPGQSVWVAVPLFEKGRFIGDYVAATELDRVLNSAIPPWFLKDHALLPGSDAEPLGAQAAARPGLESVPIHLPGAQLSLQLQVLNSQAALAPRLFFGVALICLAGMVGAVYFLWRDTVRRQRVESQLQTQMALRRAMERSVTLGLRAWDVQGRLLYVNQAFCRMVGLTQAELIGRTGALPYWPSEQGDEFQMLRERMALPVAQQAAVEVQWRHRDGHLMEVLVHGAPLTLLDGTVVGWMGSALDITERKRTERLAARQQEMLEASGRLIVVGEVASTLAHELNQPLGALSSFANGLLNRLRQRSITLDEVTPVVERMERIAEKAGRVIQRVNAFARRQDMNRQPLALTSFITRVVGQVPLPDGVSLQLDLPEGEVTLPADALLLEHALHNVVLNATEWATQGEPAQARVRVSLVRTDTMAGIRVEDSGPGVPPDQHTSIFDAFATQKVGGMGMGLSICRSLIEAHHGRIDVARSGDLHGAQFTLWLPLTP